MSKKVYAWIFVSIVLAVLLVLSVILGLSGYYFSIAFSNTHSDLKAGDVLTISAEPNQASVCSITFDGGFLPNENIPQVVKIDAKNLSSDLKVRVKTQIFGLEGDDEFDFVTSEHFERGLDGYYYYDDVLTGGGKITFCTYMVVPKDAKMSSRDKYVMTFVVETLKNDLDIEKIWGNAQNF